MVVNDGRVDRDGGSKGSSIKGHNLHYMTQVYKILPGGGVGKDGGR